MADRVLIAGGGTVGVAVARRLQRVAGPHRVTLVNPTNALTYQPLLPELAGGTIEPRHATASLRAALGGAELVVGELTGVDHASRTAEIRTHDGARRAEPFDQLVLALGSVTRLLPIPGLAERGIGFTTVAEALWLRDHVLDRLELASCTTDPAARARALSFVVVGGGYSGTEAIGELHQLAVDACRYLPRVTPGEMRWLLIEATDRILPMVQPRLGDYVLDQLRRRGIDVRLETLVREVDGATVRLSDGTAVDTDTLVWCAGVRAHPLLEQLGLPVDDKGRVEVDPCLRVEGVPGVWAAGDGARVPDIETGGECPPSAQYALRQGRRLADNIVAAGVGREPEPFRYRQRGEMIAFGRGQGVGELFGVGITGKPAWWLRHLYHVARIPTTRRKLRLWLSWTTNLAFPPQVVTLGHIGSPQPFREAAEAQGLLEKGAEAPEPARHGTS